MAAAECLQKMLRALADYPGQVHVQAWETNGVVTLEVGERMNPADFGNLCGKEGTVATACSFLMARWAAQRGIRVTVNPLPSVQRSTERNPHHYDPNWQVATFRALLQECAEDIFGGAQIEAIPTGRKITYSLTVAGHRKFKGDGIRSAMARVFESIAKRMSGLVGIQMEFYE